jgi:hypothetical protein
MFHVAEAEDPENQGTPHRDKLSQIVRHNAINPGPL